MLNDTSAARPRTSTAQRAAREQTVHEPTIVQCHETVCGTRPRRQSASGDVIKFRRHQLACFRALRAAQLRIMIMPTGAGKTLAMMGLALDDLAATGRKQLIVYPTRDIAPNFGGAGSETPVTIDVPGRGPMQWTPRHAPTQVLDTLIDFLVRPAARKREHRIMICTHQALALADQEIRRRAAPKDHFSGVSLYVDEAHHCGWGDAQGSDPRNRLAAIVQHYVDHQPGSLTLVTATFMRADGEILPQHVRDRFVRYEYAVPDYLETCAHLRGMRIHFVLGRYDEAFGEIVRQDPKAVTIAWTPPGLYKANKRRLVDTLLRRVPASVRARTLDLTTSDGRETVRAAFHATKFDPVRCALLTVAHNMLLEGGDHKLARRGIMIGPRQNIATVLQMIGRLLRDVPGKSHVDVYIIIPRDRADQLVPKEQLEDYLSAMLIALVAGWAFSPCRVIARTPKEKRIQRGVAAALDNPEHAHRILMDMSREIASHGDDPAMLDEALHGVLLRAADSTPDLAGQQDSEVRAATIRELQTRLREPTRHAENAITRNRFRGARHLIDLKLTDENVFGRFVAAYGYQCGYESLRELGDALRGRKADITLTDIRHALNSTWLATSVFPAAASTETTMIRGTAYTWARLRQVSFDRYNQSWTQLRCEITGEALFAYDEWLDYIEKTQTINGLDLKKSHHYFQARRLGLLDPRCPTAPYTIYAKMWSGWPWKKRTLAQFSLDEWLAYVTQYSPLSGYDLTRRSDYKTASKAGLLDSRCPGDPYKAYRTCGGWAGWPWDHRQRGHETNFSKLSETDVRQIRSMSEHSGPELAKRFHVSKTTVSQIRRHRTWTHVD